MSHSALLSNAIATAATLHAGQTDKAGEPYILHPLRVMMRLTGDNERIAAVLHDTIEDTDYTLDDLRYDFGPDIADAVEALTRRKGEDYGAFIKRCGANAIARSVKWADLRDNLDPARLIHIAEPDKSRLIAKYRPALDHINQMAAAYASAGEAGTATTPQSGVVHEHAVAKPDAQPPSGEV